VEIKLRQTTLKLQHQILSKKRLFGIESRIEKIKKNMKNLFIYCFTILSPIGILIWLSRTDLVDSTLFVLLLFFYAFIFRTYVDGKRLADKNIIPKKDIWKMIIPGKHFEYFKELYLKK